MKSGKRKIEIGKIALRLVGGIWRLLGRNNFIRTIWAGIIFGICCLIGTIWLLKNLSSDLPDLDRLKQYEPRLTTRILDCNGEVLAELFAQRRLMVPLNRIPQHTIDAIITIEDRRFFNHWGVDIIRIGRAAFVDITTFSFRQGASTITQQLARDLYLHKRRTIPRKIREVLTALQIESHYSKREILEMYLTQIYFGHGAYGIAAASYSYFGKPPDSLSIAESALLAALPKAPARYSPRFHPDRALQRRNLVLRLMLSRGVITRSQYNDAIDTPIDPIPRSDNVNLSAAPYYTEMIRQQLSEEGRRLGFDYLSDGLTVRTTLDINLQRIAESAIEEHIGPFQSAYRRRFVERSLKEVAVALYNSSILDRAGEVTIPLDSILTDSLRIDSLFYIRSMVQVALVAIEPQTGNILAMVGGRDFARSKFNRAVQAIRQPGSVFKPVAYTTAIDNGYQTTFEILNQDVVLVMADGTRWVPQNYDGSKGGMTTLREGLRRSLNLVTVRLVQEVVPPSTVVHYARQLGFTTRIDAVDAIGLGASGVIPLEATAAFGVFAAGGVYSEPRSLLSIKDRFGEKIASYPTNQRVALSKETAFIMTDLLRDVINRGTGGSARWKWNFYVEAAGKTGTTNDFTDAWFIGFTPKLVCGVWVGLDDPAESLGRGQSGAVAALPIWAKFMKTTYDSLGWKDVEFEQPPGVVQLTVCDKTKDIATPYCPVKVKEYFRQDTRPMNKCRKHRHVRNP